MKLARTKYFFGHSHTKLEYYETAFYSPFLSDWCNFSGWIESGAIETLKRAPKTWKAIPEEFEDLAMDEATKKELNIFVEQRKSEGGVLMDF